MQAAPAFYKEKHGVLQVPLIGCMQNKTLL